MLDESLPVNKRGYLLLDPTKKLKEWLAGSLVVEVRMSVNRYRFLNAPQFPTFHLVLKSAIEAAPSTVVVQSDLSSMSSSSDESSSSSDESEESTSSDEVQIVAPPAAPIDVEEDDDEEDPENLVTLVSAEPDESTSFHREKETRLNGARGRLVGYFNQRP
eukprot:Blabericola_migrator_1__4589@NODE_2437_length_2760_cov_154_476792_g1526_i0_p2_GENE_NODE_2437_length_2760_cov_154_476792_g1526_i0NODE_2437_length_2760_cov_154_476792_g1526_i0_p2_ORF_typecomplete_len161_score28_38DUF5308/PF17233_2/0_015GCP5Mod21/PF14609_6/0_2_NODE_2437_length_2760_cov_154_476792_g1526_i09191401